MSTRVRFFDLCDTDILLNVFLAIAVDNLADAQSLSETETDNDELNEGKCSPVDQVGYKRSLTFKDVYVTALTF